MARRPILIVVLAAAVALLAAGVAVVAWSLVADDDEPREMAAGARAFLDAYEQSRLGTYVVVTEFRRSRDGAALTGGRRHIAQRPPDRLEITETGLRARRGRRQIGCLTGPDGEMDCRERESTRSYAEVVSGEVARLRDQVLGPGRIYNVTDLGDGCFRLRLVRPIPAPPYGELAQLCFDHATGALAESVVEREGDVVDRTVAVELRAEVTEDDLALPEEATG